MYGDFLKETDVGYVKETDVGYGIGDVILFKEDNGHFTFEGTIFYISEYGVQVNGISRLNGIRYDVKKVISGSSIAKVVTNLVWIQKIDDSKDCFVDPNNVIGTIKFGSEDLNAVFLKKNDMSKEKKQNDVSLPSWKNYPRVKITEMINEMTDAIKADSTIHIDTEELRNLIRDYNDKVVPF